MAPGRQLGGGECAIVVAVEVRESASDFGSNGRPGPKTELAIAQSRPEELRISAVDTVPSRG